MELRWRAGDVYDCPRTVKCAWNRHVRLQLPAREECCWWEDNVESFLCCSTILHLHPPMAIDCGIHCYAGKDGGGAHIQIQELRSILPFNCLLKNLAAKQGSDITGCQFRELLRQGLKLHFALTPEQARDDLSSTWRELYTVLRILLECCKLLLGCSFTVHLDNASEVIAMGGKAPQCTPDKYYCGSMKADIQELVIKILDVTGKCNMQTQYVCVPRDENVIADYLSHEWERSHYGFSVEQS
eukprot:1270224-Rhodomonas_salina.1